MGERRKTILLTGASRGIGHATVKRFSDSGWRVLTSSREETDLIRSYDLGVNAYVVKPVDFQKFLESVKQIGFFWAIVNEPPPGTMKRSG